ncbi:MAG TPA: hypothetical protein VJ926_03070 [Patescibacteria group bacterium]|nr:hypothetical protein [Patescibacteria group bacterium]
MKNLVFLLVIVASSLILFSCEKDEPNPEPDYTYICYRIIVHANLEVYNACNYTVSDIYPADEYTQDDPIIWNDDFAGFEDIFILEKDVYLGQTMTVSFYVEDLGGSAYYEDERQILIEAPEGYGGLGEYIEIVFTVPDP